MQQYPPQHDYLDQQLLAHNNQIQPDQDHLTYQSNQPFNGPQSVLVDAPSGPPESHLGQPITGPQAPPQKKQDYAQVLQQQIEERRLQQKLKKQREDEEDRRREEKF